MKDKKMSASKKAMHAMAKDGGLKGYMKGGDVTDSLRKAQTGNGEKKPKSIMTKSDSLKQAKKYTDDFYGDGKGQSTLEMMKRSMVTNRHGWFGYGDANNPKLKKYVEEKMTATKKKKKTAAANKAYKRKDTNYNTFTNPAKKKAAGSGVRRKKS
jgi:hypothetical protein